MATDFDFGVARFEFKGFKELYKSILHLSEATLSKELSPMLLDAVEPIRDTAEAIAPDDIKTGIPDLHRSIEKSTRQRSGRAKRDRKLGKFAARVFVGPSRLGYPQAIMMEFGTFKDFPQPYMRPAFDAQKQNVVKILGIRFGDHIAAIAKKYGGPR